MVTVVETCPNSFLDRGKRQARMMVGAMNLPGGSRRPWDDERSEHVIDNRRDKNLGCGNYDCGLARKAALHPFEMAARAWCAAPILSGRGERGEAFGNKAGMCPGISY